MSINHSSWPEVNKTKLMMSDPTRYFLRVLNKLELSTDMDYMIIWIAETLKETNEALSAQKDAIVSLGVPVGP